MALFKDIISYNAQKLMKLSDSHQSSGSYQIPPHNQYTPQPSNSGAYHQPPAHYQNPQYGQYQSQTAHAQPSGYVPNQAYRHPQPPFSNSPIPPPYTLPNSQPPPAMTAQAIFPSAQPQASSYIPQEQDQVGHTPQPTTALHVRIAREAEDSKTFILSNVFNHQPIFIISRADPSKKKLLHVSRPNAQLMATIKFGYTIHFTLHDEHGGTREGKLKKSELTDKWSWRTLAFAGEKWVWKMRDHTTGELKNERGDVVARIEQEGGSDGGLGWFSSKKKKDKGSRGAAVSKFEMGGLSTAGIDEILVTGFAAFEQARRDQGEAEGLEAVAEVLLGGA